MRSIIPHFLLDLPFSAGFAMQDQCEFAITYDRCLTGAWLHYLMLGCPFRRPVPGDVYVVKFHVLSGYAMAGQAGLNVRHPGGNGRLADERSLPGIRSTPSSAHILSTPA